MACASTGLVIHPHTVYPLLCVINNMAQRRMFSPEIVCSEEFLDMPVSSRELYFQLGMRADDDGFVQQKAVMRLIGASQDDLTVLLTKRFLLTFDSGVVVVKHWLIHNMIRADRYKPTRFQEEKNSLFIKENKSYTDWQPNGNQPAPQVRLGKDSKSGNSKELQITNKKKNMGWQNKSSDNDEDLPVVGEDGEIKKEEKKPKHEYKAVYLVFKEVFGKKPNNWLTNKTQQQCAENLFTERGLKAVKNALEFYKTHKEEEYCPQITSPYDLDSKWTKLATFKQKHGN